jgi:two-component system, response regulator / RNA-binding antiterminator
MKVLLIDSMISRAERIGKALEQAGHAVRVCKDDAIAIGEAFQGQHPDALVIASDSPSRDALENLAAPLAADATPVLIFEPHGNAELMQQAIAQGVTTYIQGDVAPEAVEQLLQLTVQRFAVEHELKQALKQARSELEDRKVVDKAKALIMQNRQMTEPEAYALLRSQAMQKAKRIADVARTVVDAAELLKS